MNECRIKEQITQQNFLSDTFFIYILFYFYAFPEQHQKLERGFTEGLITGIIHCKTNY